MAAWESGPQPPKGALTACPDSKTCPQLGQSDRMLDKSGQVVEVEDVNPRSPRARNHYADLKAAIQGTPSLVRSCN
jgi:hypothetical protein